MFSLPQEKKEQPIVVFVEWDKKAELIEVYTSQLINLWRQKTPGLKKMSLEIIREAVHAYYVESAELEELLDMYKNGAIVRINNKIVKNVGPCYLFIKAEREEKERVKKQQKNN